MVALDETVRSNNQRFCTALAQRDVDTLMSFYDDDIRLLAPAVPPIEGRDAVRAYYENVFGAGLTEADLRSAQIDDLSDAVIDVGTYWMAIEPTDAARSEATGKYIHVLRRRPDGGLAIWRDIFQPDA
jgi:ketosteroid isomerase-like protein